MAVADHQVEPGANRPTGPRRWPVGAGSRAVDRALALVAVALGLLLVVVSVLVVDSGFTPLWVLLLFPGVAAVYGVAGLVLWHLRPANRLGALMVVGAVAWAVAGAVNTQVEPLVSAGLVTATVPLAVIVHLLLAFPSGQLRSTPARVTVAAGYVVALVLQAPQYLYVEGLQPPPFDVLAIDSRPDLVERGFDVQRAIGALVMLATAVVLVRRWRGATSRQRRVVAPLGVLGIASVMTFPLSEVIRDLVEIDVIDMVAYQLGGAALVPVAFAVAILRGGFARTGELEELAVWLGAEEDGRPALVDALAATLGDPTVGLLYWVEDRRQHVDADGVPDALPAPASGRGAVEVAVGDRRVGAITYDATLIGDDDVVRTAGRVVALAIDRQRLIAELRASRAALRETLGRVVEAGDAERRRIARDLHDGIQAQCVILSLHARQLPGGDELAERIDAAAADVRGLVHGVMPALLVERGLFTATEDLVDRTPVPTTFTALGSDRDLPPVVESTAYFVVAEAVGNAIKHADADRLVVELAREDGVLSISVEDDGCGGARPGTGTGLVGMADRIGVVEGRLHVDSPAGAGTRIRAEVPCAS